MNSDSILTDSGRNKSLNNEERMTRVTKRETPDVSSLVYLALAGGAVALSLGLALSKKKKGWANFVGQWVPTILLFGMYDKVIKSQAAEKNSQHKILH
jgi:hypothetical protein